MKAIVATKSGAQLQDIESPNISEPHEVRVRVRAAAICRTDVYAATGWQPVAPGLVLGHEFTGIVDAVGPEVSRFKPDDRVVANPSLSCGKCRDCRSRASHRCGNTQFLGLDRNGAFAEFIVVPEQILHRLPATLPFSLGTFAEPVAAGMGIFESGLKPNDRILLLGSGRITWLTEKLLRNAGYGNFVVTDKIPADGERFDGLIETCGLAQQSEEALRALRPGGTLVLKSREPVSISIPVLPMIQRRLNLVAVKYGPFVQAIEFVVAEATALAGQLDDRWRLHQFETAFDLARNSEDSKLCFQIGDSCAE